VSLWRGVILRGGQEKGGAKEKGWTLKSVTNRGAEDEKVQGENGNHEPLSSARKPRFRKREQQKEEGRPQQ